MRLPHLVLVTFVVQLLAPCLLAAAPAKNPALTCEISDIGPDHTRKVVRDAQGRRISEYVEVATGLNHWDPTTRSYVPSSNAWEVANGKAFSVNAPFQVSVAGNINAADGHLDVLLPDGQTRLKSQVIGIAYMERTGRSIFVAETHNAGGVLLNTREILMTNAFDLISASVSIRRTRASISQDIVLREKLPDPEKAPFNMRKEGLLIQVWSEFKNPGNKIQPRKIKQQIPREEGWVQEDETLDFGSMRMVEGQSFIRNEAEPAPEGVKFGEQARVAKEWIILEGRTFLVESIPWKEASRFLDQLPAAAQAYNGVAPQNDDEDLAPGGVRRLPTSLAARQTPSSEERISIAAAPSAYEGKRLVIDYSLVATSEGLTFSASNTYLLLDSVNLSGTTTIEGGACIKYAPMELDGDPSLFFYGPLLCRTSPYHPAILTDRTDNTVGESIPSDPPTGWYYGFRAIQFYQSSGPVQLHDLHIRNSYIGVGIWDNSGSELKHCQFVNTRFPIYAARATVAVRNCLVDTVDRGLIADHSTVSAEHVTFDNVSQMLVYSDQSSVSITNSIFVNVVMTSNFVGASNATNNDANAVFQTLGKGYHYLGYLYHGIGSTNIDPVLRVELRKRTTYPPSMPMANYTTDTILERRAPPDENPAPDLGYHYDCLDYVIGDLVIENCTVVLTNASIGFYGGRGFTLQNGASFISEGRPDLPNRLVRYNTVHEQYGVLLSNPSQQGLFKIPAGVTTVPTIRMRFTEASFGATDAGKNDLLLTEGSSRPTAFDFRDGTLRGAIVSFNTGRMGLTNNLVENCGINCDADVWLVQNNTFVNSSLALHGSPAQLNAWAIRDNLFDHGSLTDYVSPTPNSHNAYIGLSPLAGGANNQTISVADYLSGPLGDYYLPATGANLAHLLDAGSGPASSAGLYHYTTRADQTKEGSSTVDIGMHRVAVNGQGAVYDTNADGAPDYVADANGNGLPDGGEVPWGGGLAATPSLYHPVRRMGNPDFWRISLVLSCNTPTAEIYYTVNGGDPVPGDSSTILYRGLGADACSPRSGEMVKVKARAFASGLLPSPIASFVVAAPFPSSDPAIANITADASSMLHASDPGSDNYDWVPQYALSSHTSGWAWKSSSGQLGVGEWLRLDLHSSHRVSALQVYAGLETGNILKYRVYITDDPTSWGQPVGEGDWQEEMIDPDPNSASFTPKVGRYVILECLNASGGLASVSDLQIFGIPYIAGHDNDGDGMQDNWEETYFWAWGAPSLAQGANDDPDGDGYTNLQEYNNFTDPTIGNSGEWHLWRADEGMFMGLSDDSPMHAYGLLQGEVSWTNGIVYSGVRFAGGSVAFPGPGLNRDYTACTLACWMKADELPVSEARIMGKGTSQYGLTYNPSGEVTFYFGNLHISAPVRAGEWHHVTGVYGYFSSWEMRLYVDGALVAQLPTGALHSGTGGAFTIGDSGGLFKGSLDEIRFYSSAILPVANDHNWVDSDGDGLPDGWERTYFSDLSASFDGDPDHDGWSNLQEFQRGSNPALAQNDEVVFHLDEGQGIMINDSESYHVTGVFNDHSGWVSGLLGSAIHCDGYDIRADFGNPPPLSWNLTELTLSFWMKADDLPAAERRLVGKGTAAYGLRYDPQGYVRFYVNTFNTLSSVAAPVAPNKWHHVAAVLARSGAGSELKLYIDGVLANSLQTSFLSTGTGGTFSLSGGGSSTYMYKGSIDEVHFYARAVPESTILALAGSGTARWRFDESSGVTITDSGPLHVNGGVIGALNRVTGWSGTALQFDGTTTYVEMGNPLLFAKDTDRLTVAFWLYADELPSSEKWLAGKGTANFLVSYTPSGAVKFCIGNAGNSIQAQALPGGWHHVAATFGRNPGHADMKLYVDGVLRDSRESSVNSTGLGSTFRLGGSAGSMMFKGRLDDVQYMDHEATPAEVLQLSDADDDGMADPWELSYWGNTAADPDDDPDEDGYTNLEEFQMGSNPLISGIFLWALDEQAGPVIADSSPNHVNGAWNGLFESVPGVIGTALRFDGQSSYISFGANPDLDRDLTSLGIYCWIKPEAWPAGQAHLIGKDNGAYSLTCNSSGLLSFQVGNSGNFVNAEGLILGSWNLVVATFQGGMLTLRINDATAPPWRWSAAASTGTGGSFTIGGKSGGSKFTGLLDAVEFSVNKMFAPLSDQDEDHLPDVWEAQMFGNLSQTDAGDYDHDGFSNLDEYNAGTDAASSISFPKILDLFTPINQ